jgi:putative ABC transport system permease protein
LRLGSVALRNLRRTPFRSFAIAAAMALMTGSILAIAQALLAAQRRASTGAEKRGADIIVMPAGASKSSTPRFLEYATAEKVGRVEVIVPQYGGRPAKRIPGVAAVSAQLSLWLDDLPWADGRPVQLVGLEQDSDLTVLAWLPGGLARPLGSRDALVGHAWAKLDAQEIELAGARFRVAGVLDRSGTQGIDRSVFVHLEAAWELASKTGAGPSDGAIARPVSRLMVRSSPSVEPQRTANFIRVGIGGVDAELLDPGLASLGAQLRLSVRDLLIVAAAIWGTALLLVGSAASMVMRERQRELGLLRAMGATKGGILEMLTVEMLTLCTAGGLVGVAVVLAAVTAMGGALGNLFGTAWAWPDIGRTLLLGLCCALTAPATGLLATLGPGLRAVSLEPHAAIQDAP